jgi:hypothetical protein
MGTRRRGAVRRSPVHSFAGVQRLEGRPADLCVRVAVLEPGVRIAAFPRRIVSVFGAVGGGYARHTEGQIRIDGAPNAQPRDTNTGAIQFGGSIDVLALQWLAFRGDVRDIDTRARQFSIQTPPDRVHNVNRLLQNVHDIVLTRNWDSMELESAAGTMDSGVGRVTRRPMNIVEGVLTSSHTISVRRFAREGQRPPMSRTGRAFHPRVLP